MYLCNQTSFVMCLLIKCLSVFYKAARTNYIYSVYMFHVLTRSSCSTLNLIFTVKYTIIEAKPFWKINTKTPQWNFANWSVKYTHTAAICTYIQSYSIVIVILCVIINALSDVITSSVSKICHILKSWLKVDVWLFVLWELVLTSEGA